ncbi:MAG: lysophospholipid acyltransferase family protein [Pseudomonadota bacterium]
MTKAINQQSTYRPSINHALTISHRIEYAAVVVIFWFFKRLGLDASSALAGKFCRSVGPRLKKISSRATENIAASFPSWSPAEVHAVMCDAWENLGRTAAEYAHLEEIFRDGSRRIEVIGVENLERAASDGHPIIFCGIHMGNWELQTYFQQLSDIRYKFVYRPVNNPLIDKLIFDRRDEIMHGEQIPKSTRASRGLIEALREGGGLGLIVDQKLNSGVSAPLLGRMAKTAATPARLALKFDAAMLPIHVQRRRGAYFRLVIGAPLPVKDSGDVEKDVHALTCEMNDALSEIIRNNPSDWLWFHRRWAKPTRSNTAEFTADTE